MNLKEAIQITNEYLERPRARTRRKDLNKAIRKVTDYAIIADHVFNDMVTISNNGGVE